MSRPERIPERFPLIQDPPFSLDGTRTFLFLLPCDPTKLDALLARTFGWAAPDVTVSRLGSHCLLAVTDTAQARAADPTLGHFAYREATFFVPVTGTRAGNPFTALHVPFIYPTEGLAVAAGREIYGLPKKPAQITVPSDDDFWNGVAPIAARALAAQQFDGSAWQDEALFTITATAQSPAAALADAMLDQIDALFGPLPVPHLFGQDLVQLKQVPDVVTHGVPPRSLYRAITHVEAPVDNVTAVRVGDPSKVTLHFASLASEPIREVLGLAQNVTPTLATSFTMDFGFGDGEVWLERPTMPSVPATKERVLILGGGLGALSTAFELTATDALRDRFDVRILARGHLLGGKGASWRNRAKADRIEEHGLHVIFGFYHNFLRQFREVYAELARPLSVDPSTFDEAFHPQDVVVFHDGADAYPVRFPRTPANYGAGPMSLSQQLQALGALAQSLLGGTFTSVLGSILPGGNPVARDIAVFVATLARGVIDDVVIGGKSWEDLDQYDFRDWMKTHEIFPGVDLAGSAIMQVPYDGVFAYEGADQSNPRLSAGIAARGLLKLVTDYQRAVFFEMTTGMGEAVFAPMYELLKQRGVKIEFFANVKEARLVGGSVDEVVYARQAEVLAGPYDYDPLETIGSVRCWRQHPHAAQLDPASPALTEDPNADSSTAPIGPDVTLTVGADFDWVVCALPAPVTARVLKSVPAGTPLARIGNIPTVATLHLQTWLDDHRSALGWTWNASVLGGFRQPLNSLQENTRLLGVESWPLSGPQSLLYASGPFGGGWSTDSEDPAARAAAAAAARAEAKTYAVNELGKIFTAATSGGTFDLARLHSPWTPADPFADQFVSGNIDRSARYVLCVPGGLADRPEPEWQSASNLRLAGDWTKNGIDIPCMEGACVSGIRAASSIIGVPPPILV